EALQQFAVAEIGKVRRAQPSPKMTEDGAGRCMGHNGSPRRRFPSINVRRRAGEYKILKKRRFGVQGFLRAPLLAATRSGPVWGARRIPLSVAGFLCYRRLFGRTAP